MFCKRVLFAIFAAIFCQQIAVGGSPDYSGCKVDYQCFGLPSSCVDTKNCPILLKTQAKGSAGDVEFTLFWITPTASTDTYVAAALSTDTMMGDDATTVLSIGSNGSVKAEQGLTNGHRGVNIIPGVSGISVSEQKYSDGLLTAKWTRAQNTTLDKLSFNLKTEKYFILLANGPVSEGKIKFHSRYGVATSTAVNLEGKP